MKKIILLITLVLTIFSNTAYSQTDCGCCQQTKCLDLITSMFNERATLYNVLNLTDDQQKCKDVIDKKRYEELSEEFKQYEQEKFVLARLCEHNAGKNAIKQQEKLVEDIEKRMGNINKKYDKEFKSVLNSEQKSKLNTIRKMEKKQIKYCQKNKAFYKRDKNLRPFGEKMYYSEDNNVLCPVHNKWHLFGIKHKK